MYRNKHHRLLEMMPNRIVKRGFTLIELMVTVAIIAIAMMIAVPNMSAFQRNAELASTTNTLLASINTARSEAMKRGMNAMVRPIDTADWSKGWVVFVDVARDGDRTNPANIIVATQDALSNYFTVTGFNVSFNASGFATGSPANGTFVIKRNDLSGTEQTKETRKVVVDLTGRVRSCKPATDANC